MVELTDTVGAFLGHVASHFQQRVGLGAKEEAGASTVRPLPPAVRYWFEEAETAAPWDGLLKACSANFSAEGHGKSPSFWRHALKHWLRRSGVYIDSLRSVPLDPRSITDRLVADIRRTDEKVTLLALLEGVQFTRATMDFSDFTIVRPDSSELETLLGVEINRVFYPHALTSTSRLSDHWYIRAQLRQDRQKIGRIYFQDPFSEPVRPQYTQFPPVIEAALKRIVLWDWLPDYFHRSPSAFEEDAPWHGCSIPFVIAASDDPFKRPPPAPDVENLYYEPVFDPAGEEIGERSGVLFTLNTDETIAFEAFLREIEGQLRSIHETAGDAWSFVDLALSYVTKAFFADGLEQMLWHIVALEALLGENQGRITERLARRLASVYSVDESQARTAGIAFKKLYELRGELVHGRPFKSEMHRGQLRIARILTRVAALRMLKLLSYVSEERGVGRLGILPNREEILHALDFDRRTATRLTDLLRAVLPFLATSGPATGEP